MVSLICLQYGNSLPKMLETICKK